MLIMMIVYLSIGVIITFGPAKKDLFELVKEDSLTEPLNDLGDLTRSPIIFILN